MKFKVKACESALSITVAYIMLSLKRMIKYDSVLQMLTTHKSFFRAITRSFIAVKEDCMGNSKIRFVKTQINHVFNIF
jgi:hypothetical protein